MLPNSWELATLACKFLIYTATAMIAGGLLHLGFFNDSRRRTLYTLLLFVLVGALLGFHAGLVYFLVQIGLINAAGLAGMFDWGMASLMLETPLGETTFWRLGGYTFLLPLSAFSLWRLHRLDRPPTRRLLAALQISLAAGLLLLLFSYTRAGHVSVLAPPAQLALMAHVAVFACWIGSLPLFYPLLRQADAATVQWAMRRFGNQALVLVGILVLAGVVMLWYLLQAPRELIATDYGRALLVKFSLVLMILGIAALNRFYLAPALARHNGAVALRRSLHAELATATAILLLTAYVSTLVGPME